MLKSGDGGGGFQTENLAGIGDGAVDGGGGDHDGRHQDGAAGGASLGGP